jgi:hypothetical protein
MHKSPACLRPDTLSDYSQCRQEAVLAAFPADPLSFDNGRRALSPEIRSSDVMSFGFVRLVHDDTPDFWLSQGLHGELDIGYYHTQNGVTGKIPPSRKKMGKIPHGGREFLQ